MILLWHMEGMLIAVLLKKRPLTSGAHVSSCLDSSTSDLPTTAAQPQNEVVTQLLPALMEIHEAIERLVGNQTTQAPVTTSTPPVVEPLLDEPAQGVMPTNADNLSAARR